MKEEQRNGLTGEIALEDFACPGCGNTDPKILLGILGTRWHLRCRYCGCVSSIAPSREEIDR